MTYPRTDSSDRTQHPEVAITQPGVIQYTLYVRKGCHCGADIMIVADDNVEIERAISTVS